MGLVRAKITLSNPRRPAIAPLEVDALVDSGATHLCIPPALQAQLALDVFGDKRVTVADGRSETAPYAGPVEIRFKNRACFTGAMVLGTEVLLGSIPMEDMDVVILPLSRTLDVNPASPGIAQALAK